MRAKILLLTAVLCGLSLAVFSQERILNYESEIVVNRDASLDVVETIKVVCEGNRIRHGIYRDFPTRYRDYFGNNYKVDFNLRSVSRDGVTEDFHTEDIAQGKRIYIGSKGRLLANGEYTYAISYHVTRQLGFFKDYDELYWNVTGNGWEFAIESARAIVHLLPEAKALASGAYTGVKGSRGQDFTVNQNGDEIIFKSTRAFSPNEGLTVYVDWPKGFVAAPTMWDKFTYLLKDNASAVAGLIGIIILFLYYFSMWAKVGRDPQKGVIIPLYEPPKEFSPAACRYLAKMDYDNKDFACALVNMAVNGFLTITEAHDNLIFPTIGSTYIFKKTGADNNNLSAEEKAIAEIFFCSGDTFRLEQENHECIAQARAALSRVLKKNIEQTYFLSNAGYFVVGLGLSVLIFVVQIMLSSGGNIIAIVVMFIVIGMDIIFYHLLKAPTMLGRAMLDKIEGFKLYINTAEKDTIAYEVKNKSPQFFEKYLPYAMALDVEKAWSNKLASAFDVRDGQNYTPVWYHGSNFATLGAAGFYTNLGTSLASSVSTAAVAPGSSSGGGGFSGGGGGGGGGGGW